MTILNHKARLPKQYGCLIPPNNLSSSKYYSNGRTN